MKYTVPADRIVAGTYLTAAMAEGGSIFLEQAPAGHLAALFKAVKEMGGSITINKEGIGIDILHRLKSLPYLKTEVYDGFPTDLQSPMMAVMALAEGQSVIE